MMKKLIYKLIISIFCLSLYSCVSDTEIDEVFEENTQVRVSERLKELNELLLSSEFGWETDYMPGGETGVYKMHLLFNDDGSVAITSDHNNGDNDVDANYRVGISQAPELVFENYSVFANLTDNFDGTVASTNFGRDAEFQFTFTEEANEEKIVLKSKSDIEIQDDEGEFISKKTVLTLVKATASSKDEIMALQGLDERINDDFNPDPSASNPPFRGFRIEDGSSATVLSTDFTYNSFDRSARLVYDKDGEDVNEVLGIGLTEEGLFLAKAFEFDGKSYQNFIYDETANEFVAEVDGFRAYITRGDLPFYINRDYEEIRTEGFPNVIYRPTLGRNQATSDEFIQITERISDAFSGFGFFLFEFRMNFLAPDPSLPIDSSVNSDPNLSRVLVRFTITDGAGSFFDFDYIHRQEVVDRKLRFYFDFAVDDGLSPDFQPDVQELLDFVASPDGLIYSSTGDFRGVLPDGTVQAFSNQTAQFLSSNAPDQSVYMIWVGF